MAYEVTATRKRPQSFDELAGQDFVVSTLKSSITTGRIAHAYLFSGPRGVGKTSAARILARALNCETGPTATPCGTCPACVEIARGNSLDVIEIDGASNTSVNDVREIKDEVLFAPNSSRYKVYIIDEVHMLSNSAFNALLKTIEEPPPYIVFIFATTEIHKVPATIRSRCQQFSFRLLSIETIKTLLAAVCKEAGAEIEPEALLWIAKEATGSQRDAYTLLDQILSFANGKITTKLIHETLGLAGLDALGAMFEAMANGNAAAALELADAALGRGVSVEQLITDLAEYFRTALFVRYGITRESVLGYPAAQFAGSEFERFSTTQLEQAVGLLLELYRNVRFSVNQRFELDLVLCRLAGLGRYLTPTEILSRIESLRSDIAGTRGAPDGGPRQAGGGSSPIGATSPSRRESGAGRASIRGDVESRGGANRGEGGTRAGSSAIHVGGGAARAPGATLQEPDARIHGERAGSTSTSVRPIGGAVSPTGEPAADAWAGPADDETGDNDDLDAAEWQEETHARTAPPPRRANPGDPIREAVIASLQKTKVTLASALDKATSWRMADGILTIGFDNPSAAHLVKEGQTTVAAAVHDATGAPCRIVILSGQTATDEPQPRTIDDRVELVKKIFRGEVIQGGDR